MQYRTLALASSLFVMACSATPPAKEPPPSESATAAVAPPSTAPAEPPAAATAPESTAAPATTSADKASGAAPGSAVVAGSDQLGGGSLSQAEIGKILEKNSEIFGDCYTIGAGGKTKEFTATVKVKATLGPSGAVNAVQVLKSTAKNPKVDACVSEAFKKIKFPAPKNAATSVITFPIQFGGLEVVRD